MILLPNFVNIAHLSPNDPVHQWGDPSKIDHTLLKKVDLLEETLGSKLIITSGFRPNDVGSQHALGLALDLMSPTFGGTLFQFYQAAEKLGFKGLGVYPHWHYDKKTIGGIHVDERHAIKPARWMGVMDPSKHEQIYIGLNPQNLKLYGVI